MRYDPVYNLVTQNTVSKVKPFYDKDDVGVIEAILVVFPPKKGDSKKRKRQLRFPIESFNKTQNKILLEEVLNNFDPNSPKRRRVGWPNLSAPQNLVGQFLYAYCE